MALLLDLLVIILVDLFIFLETSSKNEIFLTRTSENSTVFD